MLFNFYAFMYNIQGLSISKFMFIPNNIDFVLSHSKCILKACVHYFSLFLKEQRVSWLFGRNTLERNLTYSCFIFPLLHKHLLSPELACTARFLKTSCFEK